MDKIFFSIAFIFMQLPSLLFAQLSDNVILAYDTNCTVEKGKKTIEKRFHIQVNNEQGDWITDIKIPFQKGNKVTSLEAEIRDNSGKLIRKLRKNEVTERSYISDISLYEDDYVKTFSLKHNQYPYHIFYSYSIHYSDFLWIASWTPVLHKNSPTLEAKLRLTAPVDFPVKINQQNFDGFEADTSNGQINYKWTANYLTPVKEEIHAPVFHELVPTVDIVPVSFKYGINGSHDTWASYGNWVEKLSAGLNTLPVSEQGKVHHLIKGIDDPKEKVKILYNYMQDNTRYINIAIDIGGLKPYPAEYVALNKYGDCKALTNYMKALLDVADIPSYCVDVYASQNAGAIHKDFPSQQFNHVILMVPLDGDTIWLENTSNIAPFDYINSAIQNRQGLLINGEGSRLIDIPRFDLAAVRESRSMTYYIDEELNCTSEINFKSAGPGFELYNEIRSRYSDQQQKQLLEHYLPFRNFEIKKWKFDKADRNASEISLSATLLLKNQVSKYDKDLVVRPQPLSLPDFQAPSQRTLPVRISYPTYRMDSMTFNIPAGMQVKKMSEPVITESKYGSYKIEISSSGSTINFVRSFTLKNGQYELSHYQDFYEFMQSIKNAELKNYINLQLLE